MKTSISPSWELTTEHAASSCGQPVLRHRFSGDIYGPGDIVTAYASFGPMPARAAVKRLAKTAKLDADGRELVIRFCGPA